MVVQNLGCVYFDDNKKHKQGQKEDDDKEHEQGQKEEESIGTAQEREGKQWTSGIQFGEQICGISDTFKLVGRKLC